MIVGPDEQCDDGNQVDTDLCTSQCRDARCGDRFVSAVGGEECDDGNVDDGDGCNRICELESDCGNRVVDVGEVCDDGNFINGDGCDALCSIESLSIIHGNVRIEGAIARGSKDTYTFTVDADGALLEVETGDGDGGCPAGVDTNITLNGANGLVANNDNRVGDDCSALSRELDAGVYELVVNDVDDDDAIQAYVLQFRLTQALVDGQVLTGSLPAGGDDRYRLAHDGNSPITLSTAPPGGPCPGDTIVSVYRVAADGTLPENPEAMDDNGGDGLCSVINGDFAAGDLEFVVRGANENDAFDYQVFFDVSP